METLERVIAEHPFFSGLDQQYINLFVGCASNVRFDEGTYAFREGEEANRFYVLRRGRVALEIFGFQSHVDLADAEANPNWPFDLITLWDVIEHVPDPVGLLGRCLNLLKPNGVLALKTPNRACP